MESLRNRNPRTIKFPTIQISSYIHLFDTVEENGLINIPNKSTDGAQDHKNPFQIMMEIYLQHVIIGFTATAS